MTGALKISCQLSPASLVPRNYHRRHGFRLSDHSLSPHRCEGTLNSSSRVSRLAHSPSGMVYRTRDPLCSLRSSTVQLDNDPGLRSFRGGFSEEGSKQVSRIRISSSGSHPIDPWHTHFKADYRCIVMGIGRELLQTIAFRASPFSGLNRFNGD